jgi:hypothetical protein
MDKNSFKLPLPLYNSLCIGEVKSKEGEAFDIYIGLSREHVQRLKELSLDISDTELQNNTSDFKRFGVGPYEEWYSKDRTPFALIQKSTGELAGLAWFGPKPLGVESLKHLSVGEIATERTMDAGDWHTIVYRSYPKFRGKGLMKQFVHFTMDVYLRKIPGAKLWAGIHGANSASEGLARSLGFTASPGHSNPARQFLVMIKQ